MWMPLQAYLELGRDEMIYCLWPYNSGRMISNFIPLDP